MKGPDMKLIRPHFYTVEVPCWQRPARIRLALLSDLHNNIYPGLVGILEREAPDMILIAGDMVKRTKDLNPQRFTR